MFKILKGDIFFARAKTHCIMLYYHFARKFIFKVSFDSRLNYMLHRDKASEHNNHGIQRKREQHRREYITTISLN